MPLKYETKLCYAKNYFSNLVLHIYETFIQINNLKIYSSSNYTVKILKI